MPTQEEKDMSIFIILTEQEADIVRVPLQSLSPRYQPIQRADNKYILPKSILSSVNHAAWFEFLGPPMPQLDHIDSLFPGPYEPPGA
jgi:hypothetical protein